MTKPTHVGRYIDLYRELCGTTPMLNNQECEVIRRLVEEAPLPEATRNQALDDAATACEMLLAWDMDDPGSSAAEVIRALKGREPQNGSLK